MLFLQVLLFFLFDASAFALFGQEDPAPKPPPLAQAVFDPLEFGQTSVSIPDNAAGLWSREDRGIIEIMKIEAVLGPRTEAGIPKVSLVNVATEDLTPTHIDGTWKRYEDVSGLL